jgi:cell division protein FtsB
MASSGDPSGTAGRGGGILGRVVQLARGRPAAGAAAQAPAAAHERRIEVLEDRVDQLEALIEGLQDAVHRESVRDHERIAALEKRSEPAEISRALSRDARERGL